MRPKPSKKIFVSGVSLLAAAKTADAITARQALDRVCVQVREFLRLDHGHSHLAGQDDPGSRSVVGRAQPVLNDDGPRSPLCLTDFTEAKPLIGSEVWSTACCTTIF